MEYNRWYDKYSDLKSLLSLLETIDKENLDNIAQDFIQIICSKYHEKFDEAIQIMSQNAPPRYCRWYDENYNLHTCIEFIKIINDNEKKELINSFIMALLDYAATTDNE